MQSTCVSVLHVEVIVDLSYMWNALFDMQSTVLTSTIKTRGQSNLTKSASRLTAHSPVRGHPRGSKVVPLNSWGRVSY